MPRVLGLIVRLLRDHSQSEEVAQEVMLEVWRRAPRFDPERGTAVGWIPAAGPLPCGRSPGSFSRGEFGARPEGRADGARGRRRTASSHIVECTSESIRVRAALQVTHGAATQGDRAVPPRRAPNAEAASNPRGADRHGEPRMHDGLARTATSALEGRRPPRVTGLVLDQDTGGRSSARSSRPLPREEVRRAVSPGSRSLDPAESPPIR